MSHTHSQNDQLPITTLTVNTCSPESGPECLATPAAAARTEGPWCPPGHEGGSLNIHIITASLVKLSLANLSKQRVLYLPISLRYSSLTLIFKGCKRNLQNFNNSKTYRVCQTFQKYFKTIVTYSIRIQKMRADLWSECTCIFSTGAQVGLHWQVKQLMDEKKK